jgi:hypothetical protein
MGDDAKVAKPSKWPYLLIGVLGAWVLHLSSELDTVRSKADFGEVKALSALSRVADLESRVETLK